MQKPARDRGGRFSRRFPVGFKIIIDIPQKTDSVKIFGVILVKIDIDLEKNIPEFVLL